MEEPTKGRSTKNRTPTVVLAKTGEKTPKDYSQEYRNRLKQDEVRYQAHCVEEAKRHERYRENLSDEKKEHIRKLTKERQKRYIERKKLEGAYNRVKTRNKKKPTDEARERNRLAAQKMRDSYCAKKRGEVNLKRRQRYWAQKDANLANTASSQTPTHGSSR